MFGEPGHLVPLAGVTCFYKPAEGALLPQCWDETPRTAKGGICRLIRGALGKGGASSTSEGGGVGGSVQDQPFTSLFFGPAVLAFKPARLLDSAVLLFLSCSFRMGVKRAGPVMLSSFCLG